MDKKEMKEWLEVYNAIELLHDEGYVDQEQYFALILKLTYNVMGTFALKVNKEENKNESTEH